MPVQLNHTIVPSHDKEAAARFFAQLFGLEYAGLNGHFAPVQVNDSLTLDWDNRDEFEGHHYAFLVNDQEFDQIFGRIQERGLPYWADPFEKEPGQINTNDGGRGVYWSDPNGHKLEILTVPYGGWPARD